MPFDCDIDHEAGIVTFVFPIAPCERIKQRIIDCLREQLDTEINTVRWTRHERLRVTVKRVGKVDNMLCVTQLAYKWKERIKNKRGRKPKK